MYGTNELATNLRHKDYGAGENQSGVMSDVHQYAITFTPQWKDFDLKGTFHQMHLIGTKNPNFKSNHFFCA